MRKCNYHAYIDSYMDLIRGGGIPASNDVIRAMDYIECKLCDLDVVIRGDMIDKAVELMERYFQTKLLDWELFIIALIHCYYESKDTVVFNKFLIVMGRGNGKNGLISMLAWYFTTHYHGVREYNIDIVANNEDQAKTSFEDVYGVLERTWAKSKKFFYKTKELIVNIKTNSYIRFNTSNAKTKDGGRPGCLIFDEIHGYETFDTIKVFTSGFGKKKHSRTFYITTNGYVRGGVLDEQLRIAEDILRGENKELKLLPLIYRLDADEEADNPDLWVKANPSLPYFPLLREEMEQENIERKYQASIAIEFMTKRMNRPAEDMYLVAVPWEKLVAASKPIPYDELQGLNCIGWIDFAMITDFASVGLIFKHQGKRYMIEHTFVCHKALTVEGRPLKFPVMEAVQKELITIVKSDSITADHIANWFLEKAQTYYIQNIACDFFRAALLKAKFDEVGLPLTTVRSGPITHSKIAPLIESMFAEETVVWGDNMTMRWYANNTCREIDKKGNVTYLKIEPKTRKTDGFFGLIHGLSIDHELVEVNENFEMPDVRTY